MLEMWIDGLNAFVRSIPFLFLNPFTYVLMGIILWQWRKQVEIERKLFSTKLNTVAEGFLHSLSYGLLAGVVASLLLVGIGVVFALEALLYVWLIALVLYIFRIRFLCFAYSASILAILALLASLVPSDYGLGWLRYMLDALAAIHLPSLFAIVAILHLAEALLVYIAGSKRSSPVYIESKRGRLVGAHHVQHIWFVPLLLVAEGAGAPFPPLFEGWPLFGSAGVALTLFLAPAVLSYTHQHISSTPKQKARQSSKWLAGYSLILLGLSMVALFLPIFVVVAVCFALMGHEVITLYQRLSENKNAPIYVHPEQGLKVLAVLPHSPADKMGLEPGEVIVKINGTFLGERKDFYRALAQNLAFCKLEVINIEGHTKFVSRSIYEHDHHQLGVILAPDEEVHEHVKPTKGMIANEQLVVAKRNIHDL